MSPEPSSDESAPDLQVRLKSVFGVQPKHYLGALYLILALGLVFALTILPGLTHPGTLLTVTSVPPGAAVLSGTRHLGTTPLTVFVPAGTAPLTVAKPGFQESVKDYASGSSLVLSLFLPRTDTVAVTLAATSDHSVTDWYRAEVGRWALAAPFTSDYRFPPLFTRFAADAKAAGLDAGAVRTFLLGLRGAVADPQMYLDYGRALGLWGEAEPAPDGLETQARLWADLLGSNEDRITFWVLANQAKPVRDRETAEPSDYLKARISGLQAALKAAATPAFGPNPGSLRSALGSFRGVPSATSLWGSDGPAFALPTEAPFVLPVPTQTPAFWLADAEVTQSQYAAFVAANPTWAPSARATLVAQGLADDDYLASWVDGKPAAGGEPVTAVSWYAARAYADWVNSAGLAPAGRRVSLPDEAQWEAAARAPGGASLLNQGVWEWTASAWYPGQSLVWNGAGPLDAGPAFARSLKGGVQNAKGGVKAGDRAGWPAGATNAGLGFRLAVTGSP